MFGTLEKNFKDKELLLILDRIQDLVAFKTFLTKVKYLEQLGEVD
jgi:hypothetical protein